MAMTPQYQALIQRRDGKRLEFQSLFQRKRSLEEELQSVQQELNHVQEELDQLDDQVDVLEEAIHTVKATNGNEVPPLSEPPLTEPPPLTEWTQRDLLTDPRSQTQVDDEEFTPVVASLPRPQLDLQLANRQPTLPLQQTNLKGCPFTVPEITQVLQTTFGIPSFRENQLEIIQATLSGQDAFVIMRTGGGKSLTYQLPVALEQTKNLVTVVISPLLSLMQDQYDQMNEFVPNSCICFGTGLPGNATPSQQAALWKRVRDPEQGVGMILVTPERLQKSNKLHNELQRLHNQQRLARIVIDECHCACQWGHDFRPDYAKLGVLKRHFPAVPVLAVTATASDRVRADCCQILHLNQVALFRSTANRPNLTYQVRPKENTVEDMAQFIQTKYPTQAGIVYTYSRKDADTVADELCERGIVAASYHSDVSATKKAAIHKSWMKNDTQVVVATIAFGLGINKPNVRFVLHHTLSKTLEAYYQESGRAGRDGQAADCILYYSPKDVTRMIRMVHGESSEPLLWVMIKYAQQFGTDGVCRAILLHHLGEPNQPIQRMLEEQAKSTDESTTCVKDVVRHAETVLQLLYAIQDNNVTLAMLVKEWRSRPDKAEECVRNNPPGKELSVSDCEYIVVSLMVQKIIDVNVQWTAYDSVVYLYCTEKAEQFLTSTKAQMKIRLPVKKKTPPASARKKASSATNGNGWIERKQKKPAAKRKASASTKSAPAKRRKSAPARTSKKTAPTKNSKNAKPSKAAQPKSTGPEVIELDNNSPVEVVQVQPAPRRARRVSSVAASVINRDDSDGLMDDSDEEYQFEG